MKKFISNLSILSVFLFSPLVLADSSDEKVASLHAGLLHPNGIDVVGYSVESKINSHIYVYYNFGFPSLAAAGLSYYQNYYKNGITSTVGVGIGSVLYASLAFQWKISVKDYLKLGAGYTASVAYSGTVPIISYEHRF